MTASPPRTVLDIAGAVRAGITSATHIAEAALERRDLFDTIQPQIWIKRASKADILAEARSVDDRLSKREDLPLAGVPFAVKDNIDVAGIETTAACPAFAYTPDQSAPVVDRLRAAGAVFFGKTNMDQFATGLVGTRSPFGAPACVFNNDFISGGSSSGSALAVAAGIVPFALGTDTAGSGRVPAAFNGLIGFKPSGGRWSTRGVVPACRSLDCVSVFTHTADDAASIDDCLNWFDVEDAYSRPAHEVTPNPVAPRVGVPARGQLKWFGDDQSQHLFDRAIEQVKEIGGTICQIDIGFLLETARMLYSGPWLAERAVVLEKMLANNASAIDPAVRAIVEQGLSVTGTETFRGLYDLAGAKRDVEAMWKQVDMLVLPTTPTIYRHNDIQADPIALNANLGTYTNFVNLLDMSAVAIPAGHRNNNTGFGISLIGPAHADRALLACAQNFQDNKKITFSECHESAAGKRVTLAVVGAHLSGMPLHGQLSSRKACFVASTHTAATYRLYAMPTDPPKPALIHATEDGAAIEVELYDLTEEDFGSFVAGIPPPLAIGTIELKNGNRVKGFVAEPRAIANAQEITSFGGWRSFVHANHSKMK